MLPKAPPLVTSSLIHQSGLKNTGGQDPCPPLQDPSASSRGLGLKIPHVEESTNLDTLTSQLLVQPSNEETADGGKGSTEDFS